MQIKNAARVSTAARDQFPNGLISKLAIASEKVLFRKLSWAKLVAWYESPNASVIKMTIIVIIPITCHVKSIARFGRTYFRVFFLELVVRFFLLNMVTPSN